MHGVMLNYYLYSNIINELPNQLDDKKGISKDLLFNFANFNTTPWFYHGFHKKDKYDLYNKLNSDKFNDFYVDTLIELKKDLSYEKVLFIYGIYINHYFMNKIYAYINALKHKNTNIYEALNMLDYYISNKYYNIDLKKTNLRMYFEDGFNYYPYMDKLIHNPLLKEFDIFLSKNYLIKCYKKKRNFYDFCTKSHFGFKRLFFKIGGVFRHNKNTKYYFYQNKIDTYLLNIVKKEYIIDDNKYKYTFEEYLNYIKKEILKNLSDINDYIFNDKDKKLRKLFDIKNERIL